MSDTLAGVLFFDGGLALIFFALWVFCIIDVITTPESAVRNLPKLVWLFVVILLADVGSIAWLIAGRNWSTEPSGLPHRGNRARQDAPRLRMNGTHPDDDEEFLRGLKARAEEQRRRAREAQQRDEPPGGDSAST